MDRERVDALYRQAVDISMEVFDRPGRVPAALDLLEGLLSDLIEAGDSEKADCTRRLIENITARWRSL